MILSLASEGPITAAEVKQWFNDDIDAAGQRLKRLAERKKLRRISKFYPEGKRWLWVYTRGKVKTDMIDHEVMLSQVGVAYLHCDVERRWDLPYRADLKFTVNGQTYWVEMHTGSIPAKRLAKTRYSKYVGCPDLVLWIVPDEHVREDIRALAEPVADNALFGILEDVLANPHGEVWIDYLGEKGVVPSPFDSGLDKGLDSPDPGVVRKGA